MVVLAVEGHRLLGPQLPDEPHRLAQPREALLVLRPGDTERALVQVLARADAEDHPVRKQHAERTERLGHDRGVVAKRRRVDGGAEGDSIRPLPHRRQPRERERGVPVRMAPGLEVVADKNGIEPVTFGRDRKVEELTRAELLGRSLVAEP